MSDLVLFIIINKTCFLLLLLCLLASVEGRTTTLCGSQAERVNMRGRRTDEGQENRRPSEKCDIVE